VGEVLLFVELFNTGAAVYCLLAPFGPQISANKEKKIAFLERDSYKRFLKCLISFRQRL
jgi:hypothetical protein